MALLLDVLGILSLVGFYFQYKNNPKQKLVSYAILILGIASLFVIQKVGTSGGEIRHTEIRNESNSTHNLKEENNQDK
jgi:hypothetical protein